MKVLKDHEHYEFIAPVERAFEFKMNFIACLLILEASRFFLHPTARGYYTVLEK